jgi:hypothetical protein
LHVDTLRYQCHSQASSDEAHICVEVQQFPVTIHVVVHAVGMTNISARVPFASVTLIIA